MHNGEEAVLQFIKKERNYLDSDHFVSMNSWIKEFSCYIVILWFNMTLKYILYFAVLVRGRILG